MNSLLIDIGNSAIKACIGNSDKIVTSSIKSFSFTGVNFEKEVYKFLSKYIKGKKFTKSGISVLNNKNKIILNKFFGNIIYKEFKPVFIDRNLNLPFEIDYSSGLGNDRICSTAGALNCFDKKNILVIDFGTATTYTLIIDRILTGGIISPGIKTTLKSLTDNTSLPKIELKFPKELFNRNTKDNIKAGILYQSLYSTERIIVETKKKYSKIFVIATGGLSEIIFKRTDYIDCIDKHLVLKGINSILNYESA